VSRVLEIGAGTGKATLGLAGGGRSVTCLEPDPAMAGVLASRDLPGVEVVVARFEDWEGETGFDLVFAAQAWHWVRSDVGYARARLFLRPGGVLALVWNVPVDRYGVFEDLYRAHAPHLLEEDDDRIRRRDSKVWLEEVRQAGFEDADLLTIEWEETLGPAQTRALYSSYSDHITLEEGARNLLLAGLEARVEALGGAMTHRYQTRVFTGRAPVSSS
jgi:SAM-dependent methyltransferase